MQPNCNRITSCYEYILVNIEIPALFFSPHGGAITNVHRSLFLLNLLGSALIILVNQNTSLSSVVFPVLIYNLFPRAYEKL